MQSLRRIALAAAAAGLAAGLPAFAQPSAPRPDVDLHAALHIRPDQESAFSAYQAAGPRPNEIAQFRKAQNLSALTTLQRLDQLNKVLGLQLVIFRRKADATRALYGVLNPDQQHTFDQATAPPARGGPRG